MPDSKIKFKCSISDLPTDLILQVQRIKMRSKWIKIKKFSFWLIKLKIVLCGVGGGIFWELNKKKNVVNWSDFWTDNWPNFSIQKTTVKKLVH